VVPNDVTCTTGTRRSSEDPGIRKKEFTESAAALEEAHQGRWGSLLLEAFKIWLDKATANVI